MAAHFASGFFFGLGAGGFDKNDLYYCIINEPEFFDIFMNEGLKSMKQATKGASTDSELTVKGLKEML